MLLKYTILPFVFISFLRFFIVRQKYYVVSKFKFLKPLSIYIKAYTIKFLKPPPTLSQNNDPPSCFKKLYTIF